MQSSPCADIRGLCTLSCRVFRQGVNGSEPFTRLAADRQRYRPAQSINHVGTVCCLARRGHDAYRSTKDTAPGRRPLPLGPNLRIPPCPLRRQSGGNLLKRERRPLGAFAGIFDCAGAEAASIIQLDQGILVEVPKKRALTRMALSKGVHPLKTKDCAGRGGCEKLRNHRLKPGMPGAMPRLNSLLAVGVLVNY